MRAPIARQTAALAALVLAHGSFAGVVNLAYNAPTIDRWNYPFDSAPGFSETAAVFSAIGQEDAFPGFSFDQRDAQILLAWDTNAQVSPLLGTCAYRVTAATLVISTTGEIPFRYDPTFDPRDTYPVGATDPDPGRPIEVFGVGFRSGWTAGAPTQTNCPPTPGFPCYYEGDINNGAPAFGPCVCKDQRFAFATDQAGSTPRDISNNVRDGFEVSPFATAQFAGVTPGAYVNDARDASFTLNVNAANVQAYLREALNSGRLVLTVSSLQPATSAGGPGGGEYARFFMKEHPLGNSGGITRWARLTMTVEVTTLVGDLNNDGAVTTPDLTLFLGQFGQTGAALAADFNCDGFVGTPDLVLFLGSFGR